MRKGLQVLFMVIVLYLLINILIAVYMAGMGVFVGAENWGAHRQWGWRLMQPGLILVPLALLARLPRSIVLMSGLFFVLMVVQFMLPKLRETLTYASALHPVNALLLFGLTLALLRRTWRFLRTEANEEATKEVGEVKEETKLAAKKGAKGDATWEQV